MRIRDDSPQAIEDASLDATIRTIDAFRTLGAPEPPADSLAALVVSGAAYETDISPERARYLGETMHRVAVTLRQQAASLAHCRRGVHLMTPENTYTGTNGEQCRACRNAARRQKRAA